MQHHTESTHQHVSRRILGRRRHHAYKAPVEMSAVVGGFGNAGVRIEHNEHWQGLVDKQRVDMNGTRQRFKAKIY